METFYTIIGIIAFATIITGIATFAHLAAHAICEEDLYGTREPESEFEEKSNETETAETTEK